jgi:hypothetical protein
MDETVSVETVEQREATYVYECSICECKWYSTWLHYADGADICPGCNPTFDHDMDLEEYNGEITTEAADPIIEPNMAINDVGVRIVCEDEDIEPGD